MNPGERRSPFHPPRCALPAPCKRFGEMRRTDGALHDWREGRVLRFALLALADDAARPHARTPGNVPAASAQTDETSSLQRAGGSGDKMERTETWTA